MNVLRRNLDAPKIVGDPIMVNEGKAVKIEEPRTLAGKSRGSRRDWTEPHSKRLHDEKAAFRIITIERECACGAATISKKLSNMLGWKLWDELLAQELADSIRSDLSTSEKRAQRADNHFRHLAEVFWRGSYERSAPFDDREFVDAARMVAIMQKVSDKIAREGNAVVVGRGAPGFFQDRNDTFHVFLYATREERIRRLIANGKSASDADLVEAVDRERSAFVKHYFGADWPTRSFYDLMINTTIGEDNAVSTILHTMLQMEKGKR
jgi:cytidylate kinase